MPPNTVPTGDTTRIPRRTVPRVTAQGSIQLVEPVPPRVGPRVTRAPSATNVVARNRTGNAPLTRAAARAGTEVPPPSRASATVPPASSRTGPARTATTRVARANTTTTRSTTATTRPDNAAARPATLTTRPGATMTRAAAAAATRNASNSVRATTPTATRASARPVPPPPSLSAQIMRTPSGPRTRGITALLQTSSHNSNRGLGRTTSDASLMLPPPPAAFTGMQPQPTFAGLPTPPSFAMIPATPTRRPRHSKAVPLTPLSIGSGDDSGAFLRVGTLPAPPLPQMRGQARESIGNVSLETSFGAPETTPLWACRKAVEESPVVAIPLNPREKRAARAAARAAASAARESTPQPLDAVAVFAAIGAGAPVTVADPTVEGVSVELEELETPTVVSGEESGAESMGASTVGSVASRQRRARNKKKNGKRKTMPMPFTLGAIPEGAGAATKETVVQPAHGTKRERDAEEPKRAPVVTNSYESVLLARRSVTPEQSRANAEDILRKMHYLYESGAWAPDRAHARRPIVGF